MNWTTLLLILVIVGVFFILARKKGGCCGGKPEGSHQGSADSQKGGDKGCCGQH